MQLFNVFLTSKASQKDVMLGWPYFIWTIYHHQRNNRKTAEGNHKGNGGGTKVLQDKNIIFFVCSFISSELGEK